LKPHLRKCWCTPSKQNAASVACMEDVLDLYMQPFKNQCPVICMDEKPFQLTDETRNPIPMKALKPEHRDSVYIRKDTCSIFVFTEPLASWRHLSVRERRTKVDWAHEIKDLLDVFYPNVKKVRLVMDNLNTHTLPPCTKLLIPRQPDDWRNDLRFTIPLNTGVGSTLQKSN